MTTEREIQEEKDAVELVDEMAFNMISVGAPIWKWGDGFGGYIHDRINMAAVEAGLPVSFEGEGNQGVVKRKAIARKTLLAVIIQYGMKCFYCECVLDEDTFTIDHRTPVSKGGSDDKENLVPACRSCNSRKGAK